MEILLVRRASLAPNMIICGTDSGYNKHIRNKEKTCEPCAVAHNERNRLWYKENSEKRKKTIVKWQKDNPESIKAIWRLKDTRRRSNKDSNGFEFYTEKEILEKYGTNCHICSIPIDLSANRKVGSIGWEMGLHLDHVIPLSKGGSDTKNNVRPSHAYCNLKKSNLTNI